MYAPLRFASDQSRLAHIHKHAQIDRNTKISSLHCILLFFFYLLLFCLIIFFLLLFFAFIVRILVQQNSLSSLPPYAHVMINFRQVRMERFTKQET